MAVGLAVETTAHSIVAFITKGKGKGGDYRQAHVHTAMQLMLAPISSGSASTFFGVLMLAFSNPFTQTYFFMMYVLIIAVGFIDGLFLVPFLLAIAGPPPLASSSNVSGPQRVKPETQSKAPDPGQETQIESVVPPNSET